MSLDRLTAALADRYRLERELGQGGMATVYLAEDLRHKRQVAIKVLRPELAAMLGADRFVQEITTTAALQHPHILPLFDSGESDGFLWYAMPFIDGETLRAKLDRESQLGVTEAVRIASEVADALDYAHRQGVVHRDIKPENILLHDGRPMVADFGIALALSAAAGGRMTETGMSLGTPHYMSPEQATAEKEVSNRSDIYSLGSVLYEMLAGQPPHLGGTAQQIIMKIIAEEAQPVTRLRKTVPPNVAAAVAKALEKLPADRFDSAREFGRALADPHFTTAESGSAAAPTPAAQRRLVAGLGTALAAALAVAGWAVTRQAPVPPVIRYGLALSEEQQPDPAGFVLITPDGSAIIYQGFTTGGLSQLWLKRRDALDATPIPGTTANTAAALSPDGTLLAKVAGGLLWQGPIAGGAFVEIADQVGSGSNSLAWLDDRTIAFVERNQSQISTITTSGAGRSVIWKSESLSVSNLSALPEGRGLIFQACVRPCAEASLHVLDHANGTSREIVRGGWGGQVLPSGHLIYVRDDFTGMVVPFDLDALVPRGDPVVVIDSISPSLGASPYFVVSRSGTLVMRRGVSGQRREFELVTVGRDGIATAVDSTFTFRNSQFAGNFGWAVSPDDRSVAIGLSTGAGDDIWVKPLSGAPAARVTFGRGSESRPRWTRDGRSVTFVSDVGIFMRRADGTGRDSLLRSGGFDEALLSPDGTWLLFRAGAKSAAAGYRDIFGVRIGGDSTPVEVLASQYDEMAIALSPDGKWLAYQSDETGILEVFVRPFPNTSDAKIPVSSGGGTGPLWSRDGRELFYLTPDMKMTSVPVELPSTGDPDRLRLGPPRALFRLEAGLATLNARYYTPWDVMGDGRFVMVRPIPSDKAATGSRESLIVVENWLEELQAAMPQR